jgi:hypothetical protein
MQLADAFISGGELGGDILLVPSYPCPPPPHPPPPPPPPRYKEQSHMQGHFHGCINDIDFRSLVDSEDVHPPEDPRGPRRTPEDPDGLEIDGPSWDTTMGIESSVRRDKFDQHPALYFMVRIHQHPPSPEHWEIPESTNFNVPVPGMTTIVPSHDMVTCRHGIRPGCDNERWNPSPPGGCR